MRYYFFAAAALATILIGSELHAAGRLTSATITAIPGSGTSDATTLSNFDDPQQFDFSAYDTSGGPVSITSTDPALQAFGISSITSTAATGTTDQYTTGFRGNALYRSTGGGLIVISASDTSTTFNRITDFTISLDTPHQQFGFALADAGAQTANVEFFSEGFSIGSASVNYTPTGDTDIYAFESDEFFDQIVVTSGSADTGIGFSHLVLGALFQPPPLTPEPATLSLMGIALVGMGGFY